MMKGQFQRLGPFLTLCEPCDTLAAHNIYGELFPDFQVIGTSSRQISGQRTAPRVRARNGRPYSWKSCTVIISNSIDLNRNTYNCLYMPQVHQLCSFQSTSPSSFYSWPASPRLLHLQDIIDDLVHPGCMCAKHSFTDVGHCRATRHQFTPL